MPDTSNTPAPRATGPTRQVERCRGWIEADSATIPANTSEAT